MFPIIDTHAHLYLDDFQKDIAVIISRAREKGVEKILMPNIDEASLANMIGLAADYPRFLFPMPGLHPTSVKENFIENIDFIFKHVPDDVCAVGEIGIDLYWDKSFFEQQKKAFRRQLSLAKEMKLPVIIHTRNSFEEAFRIVSEEQNGCLTGVFHCFSGNTEQAWKAVDLGFFLGIGGVVTFKNSDLPAIVKNAPLENMVLETDAPFLAPVPHRGKRNEPSYLPLVIEKMAEIRNMDLAALADIIHQNTLRLFPKLNTK